VEKSFVDHVFGLLGAKLFDDQAKGEPAIYPVQPFQVLKIRPFRPTGLNLKSF
jgi:hypothetical protein